MIRVGWCLGFSDTAAGSSFSHFNFLLNCNNLLKMCKGNTFWMSFFCLILTMRRQTDISACEIHFSVVIWIQSVTDANYILAPNLQLSLFNSVPSTWRPLLHCFVGVAMTTHSLCTHISTRKRQRGSPWLYLHRHHQGHSQQSVSQRQQPSCPWATEQTQCAWTIFDFEYTISYD